MVVVLYHLLESLSISDLSSKIEQLEVGKGLAPAEFCSILSDS
jgi:hypothetical protein